MSEKELQEKILQYQVLEEKFKELNQRRELFAVKLLEVEQTMQAIEDINKSNEDEIVMPLGSGVFAPGKINKKENMIVSLGGDIAVERDLENVKSILEKRKKILEDGIENVKNAMVKVANDMRTIQLEAQDLLKDEDKAG